jgi:hypothetical protein
MQAMQFASPKGLLNFFMGGNSSIFVNNEGKKSRSRRILQVNCCKQFEVSVNSKGSSQLEIWCELKIK